MQRSASNKKKIAKVIAKAWLDPEYKKRLKKDPEAVLDEAGVKVSGKVRVLEDKEDVHHLVIPEKPARAKDKDLSGDPHPDICSFPSICTAI